MVNCGPYKFRAVFIYRVNVVLKGLARKAEIRSDGEMSIGDI